MGYQSRSPNLPGAFGIVHHPIDVRRAKTTCNDPRQAESGVRHSPFHRPGRRTPSQTLLHAPIAVVNRDPIATRLDHAP